MGTTILILTMSTTLSRHSSVAAEASTAGTKKATQDLDPEPWCCYEYSSRDIWHHGDSRLHSICSVIVVVLSQVIFCSV
uniref:Uncharacterized protein n=1 Tax=Aegilops tauschii subsp. strangulata TaxID=200361 RepID=A0A453P3T5_AEGTS